MRIFVKTKAGNTVIILHVEPEDTIHSVKRKITDEVGIPVHRQRITFEDETLLKTKHLPKDTFEFVKKNISVKSTGVVNAEKTLQDEHTLEDYNIQRESILWLYLIPINLIPVLASVSCENMPIVVQTLTGKTITLRVVPQDPIDSVKKKLFEKEGIPVEHQCLFYADKKLKDRNTLEDYNVQRGSLLRLVSKGNSRGKLHL